MTLPQYDRKGLAAVLALPFWDCVASILNQFFPLRLQGSSLQGTEGVLPEPVYIRYKIAVAELWDTKTNVKARMEAECGACEDKKRIATLAKKLNLDAIHDTVHEMCKDEARHGKGFEGLYNRYFKK